MQAELKNKILTDQTQSWQKDKIFEESLKKKGKSKNSKAKKRAKERKKMQNAKETQELLLFGSSPCVLSQNNLY